LDGFEIVEVAEVRYRLGGVVKSQLHFVTCASVSGKGKDDTVNVKSL
jgi:hypothetical protein